MYKILKKIIPSNIKNFLKYYLPENIFLRDSIGVIHVGASFGQECKLYDHYNQNVIWIEPIPDVFFELKKNVKKFNKQNCYNYLVTDIDDKEYDFKITNNSLSSSIFSLEEHKKMWPEVEFSHSISLRSITLNNLISKENIDLNNYDTLIIDTQGSELLVLKGLGENIKNFKYIKVEACNFKSYDGGCTDEEILSYMTNHNFKEKKRFTSSPKIHEKNYKYHDILFQNAN